MTETAIETAERNSKAYLTLRRGLRRLKDAETIIREVLAIMERRDHLLGPINKEPPHCSRHRWFEYDCLECADLVVAAQRVNETTAEREGFTPAQIMQMEQHLAGEKA